MDKRTAAGQVMVDLECDTDGHGEYRYSRKE